MLKGESEVKKTLLIGATLVALAAVAAAAANANKGRGTPPQVSHRQAESREQFRADMVDHLKHRGKLGSGWKLTALGEAVATGRVDPTEMVGGQVGGGMLATSGQPVTDDEPRPDADPGVVSPLMFDDGGWGGWSDFLVGLMCDWGVPGLVTFVSGPGVYWGHAGLVNIIGDTDTPSSVVQDCHFEQCEGYAWGFPDSWQRLLFIQVNGPSYAYPTRWGCLW